MNPKNNVKTEQRILTERQSLVISIAKSQRKHFLVVFVVLFLSFIVFYITVTSDVYRDQAETIVVNLENGRLNFSSRLTNHEDYVDITITDKDGKEVYNDVSYQERAFFGVIKAVSVSILDKQHCLVLKKDYSVWIEDEEYQLTAHLICSEEVMELLRILFYLFIVLIICLIIIYYFGMRETKRLLEPLKKMSTMLEHLSVNNLHSERIDIIGADNELMDLAIVCNEMLDRLEKSYDSQKQFVSNASHELRTPIAVIQGYANLLNRWGSKDEAILSESIDALCNVSKEMQDLVEKLLFLSRHDRRTLKLKKDWFDMKEIIEDLWRETDLVVTDRNVTYPVVESVQIYGDRQMLKQAIRIFLDNAQKYTESGGNIWISCRNIRNDCEIKVEDTGIGMKRKDLDNIFERFYRSEDVRDKCISGHGLGLSIAKLIIMSHSGRIHIRTQYKKGTCFTILIPRRR